MKDSAQKNQKRKHKQNKLARRLTHTRAERYRSLIDVGLALSSEKELLQVLDLILDKSLENTNSDAASIYLTENIRTDSYKSGLPADPTSRRFQTVLRFHRSSNRTSGRTVQNKILSLDYSSIAGYVASTGQPLRVDDCYKITEDSVFKFNPQIDREINYHSISMLTVPIVSSNGKVRGVLQLINKLNEDMSEIKNPLQREDLEKHVIPFTDEDQDLMQAFASQACVAIENAKLTEDIENLFESFIRASVTAIEARDPATSGHSDRVAVLTVELARALHRSGAGPYKANLFNEGQIREIRYAALLHDFGKIGVRESVLTKEKKLYPQEMETILHRIESVRTRQEILAWKKLSEELLEMIEKNHTRDAKSRFLHTAHLIDHFAQNIQDLRLSILSANQPQVIEEDFDISTLMSSIHKISHDLGVQEILYPEEIIRLSLPRGSLSTEERREIESHVTHTYHFLRQIAWTEDLSQVTDIAHAHHEKCDGSGYPRGLTAEAIPVQSRMMTIADIYDALTSMDRPYKPAVSPERALDILYTEAREGKLDLHLLKVFIEAEIYRAAEGMRPRQRVMP